MTSLIDALCISFRCSASSLESKFYCIYARQQITDFLRKRELFTTYGKKKQIVCHGITFQSAAKLILDEECGYSVEQHYWNNCHICLEYPELPCIMYYNTDGKITFYAIELLTLL